LTHDEVHIAPRAGKIVSVRAWARRSATAWFVLVCASATPMMVQAQALTLPDRDTVIGVRERARPEYDPVGIRRGSFMFYPLVTTSMTLDDNIYAAPSGEKADSIIRIRPEVRAQSNWSRHAVNYYAYAQRNQYVANNSESTFELGAGAAGRLDLGNFDQVNGRIDILRATESRRVAQASVNSASPIRFTGLTSELGGTRAVGRVRFIGRLNGTLYNYQDTLAVSGGAFDQDFRDTGRLEASLRGEYALSPDTAFFLSGAVNGRKFWNRDVLGRTRSSSGGYLQAGVRSRPTLLTRIDVGVGYLRQTYRDPLFGPTSGLSVQAKGYWYPSGLTTVSVGVSRTIEDSADVGVSGYLSSRIDAQVDHELRRNLILTAQATYGQDNFRGSDRDDQRSFLSLRGDYYVTRAAAIGAAFEHEARSSSGAARGLEFKDNRLLISLVLRR
jgi:hypothetical protein